MRCVAKKVKEPKVKVGDKIGKLTAVEQVDMPIKTKRTDKDGCEHEKLTNKTKRGWFCKCDCGETITLPETTLLAKRSSLRSCGKCPPEKDTSYVPKEMTYEDSQNWEKLYEYVKINILGYDEEQSLPQYMTLRLLGLSRGKYIANNKSANNANYSYDVILATFKYCSPDIQRALRTNNFNSEQHKFLYITKIVENNINTVYMKMKQHQKAKEEAKNTTVEAPTHTGAEFRPRENKKDKFTDLW